MNKNKFPLESIENWYLSFDLSEAIYKLLSNFREEEKYRINSQIKREVNSLGVNLILDTRVLLNNGLTIR
jgi:hypothetical protein